jgi:hypothetical protein
VPQGTTLRTLGPRRNRTIDIRCRPGKATFDPLLRIPLSWGRVQAPRELIVTCRYLNGAGARGLYANSALPIYIGMRVSLIWRLGLIVAALTAQVAWHSRQSRTTHRRRRSPSTAGW